MRHSAVQAHIEDRITPPAEISASTRQDLDICVAEHAGYKPAVEFQADSGGRAAFGEVHDASAHSRILLGVQVLVAAAENRLREPKPDPALSAGLRDQLEERIEVDVRSKKLLSCGKVRSSRITPSVLSRSVLYVCAGLVGARCVGGLAPSSASIGSS